MKRFLINVRKLDLGILMYRVVNFMIHANEALANLASIFIQKSIFGAWFLSECSGYSGNSVMLCDEWKTMKVVQSQMLSVTLCG